MILQKIFVHFVDFENHTYDNELDEWLQMIDDYQITF